MLRSRLAALTLYQRTLEAHVPSVMSSSLTGLPNRPMMCASAPRMGCEPKSRNQAAASGLGSSSGPMSSMPALLRASDDFERALQVAVSTPTRRPSMMLRSGDRRDDACSRHGLHAASPYDHPVHSAALWDPSVMSTVTALRCRWMPSGPVWDVGEAQGWAGQTRPTSSTMVLDL